MVTEDLTVQQFAQELPGVGLLGSGHLFRRAGGDNLSAPRAALRPEVHYPIGGFYHIEVVLDHDYGIAVIPQPMQHGQQLLDIVKMQSGGGLIENIQGIAGISLGQLTR